MIVKGRVIGGCKFGNRNYIFVKTRKGKIFQCEGGSKLAEIYSKFLGQKTKFLVRPNYVKNVSKKAFREIMKKTNIIKL